MSSHVVLAQPSMSSACNSVFETLGREIVSFLPLAAVASVASVSHGLRATADSDEVWAQLLRSCGRIAHPTRGWGDVEAARVLRAWHAFDEALGAFSVKQLRQQFALRRLSTAGLLEKQDFRRRLTAVAAEDAPSLAQGTRRSSSCADTTSRAAAQAMKRLFVATQLSARLAARTFATSEVCVHCHHVCGHKQLLA